MLPLRHLAAVLAVAVALLSLPAPLLAQDDPAAGTPPAQTQAPAQQDRDFFIGVEQPDFTVITLPTTLRLPRFRSAFRVTHRFGRPLGAGSFGDLVGDMFGLDSGAQIGLEYRFGLISGTQVGIHRTSNKTIQLFGQQSIIQQGGFPVTVAVHVGVEGTDNFQEHYSTQLGAVISRTFTGFGAVYLEPIWIDNTNPLDGILAEEDDTVIVGIGLRIRVRPTLYLVGEMAPRVSGYDPGVSHASFAIEKRAGGHSFQLNFSNGFGTTLAQVARGGITNDDWYLGFNISRKFF